MKFFITKSSAIVLNKNLVLMFSLLMLLMSCGASSKNSNSEEVKLPPPHINCPEGGDCSFEVIEDAQLVLKYDQNGKLFPEIGEGDQLVIKYHYKKDEKEEVMDDSYSEYVYFEIDPALNQIILKDEELQQVKMIFGRICYCKGSMGYFKVTSGSLFLFNKDQNLQLRSSFKVNKVPQIIENIDENINF